MQNARRVLIAALAAAALAALIHGGCGCALIRPEGEAWYEYSE